MKGAIAANSTAAAPPLASRQRRTATASRPRRALDGDDGFMAACPFLSFHEEGRNGADVLDARAGLLVLIGRAVIREGRVAVEGQLIADDLGTGRRAAAVAVEGDAFRGQIDHAVDGRARTAGEGAAQARRRVAIAEYGDAQYCHGAG